MASPLLQTKLFLPRVRRDLVPRTRLSDQLGRTPRPRLTLVSAPPGFGKTTLLAAWLDGVAEDRPVAWVSLEETERAPESFWTYVVTALDTAAPGVGATALPLLGTAHPPMATVLSAVLNALSALPAGLDVVLDDYHLADSPAIASDMAFLLDHLPPEAHLVISTRADPDLPLARLRATGELVEVRAADLRFTPDEAAAYLNEVVGLGLEAADVTALESRTEGWIAALQLAALSLRGRDDAAGFIAGFAGDDRYVVDYLVEEVLARQPVPVRDFLLRTSILARLGGSLCDAVTGADDGKAVLDLLDRSNLFVVPLDDSRQWYRYHHLFADVLHTHLLGERPGEVADLHRRASRWYDAHGDPVAAVRHALAAGDGGQAADLVELALPELQRNRQEATIRRWIDAIPAEEVRVRPVLAVGFIGALMSGGEFDGIAERLDESERLLESPPEGLVVRDEAGLARLPSAIAMYRAAVALIGGDPVATIAQADRAVTLAAEDDHLILSAASALSGLASWGSGDLDAAHRGYSAAVDGLRRAGHLSDVLGCSVTLADLEITQGRLRDARRTYDDALRLAAQEPEVVLRGTPDMLVGLSRLAFERDDLGEASDLLDRAEVLGEPHGLPRFPYRRRVMRARVRALGGDLAGAVTLLEDAERVYDGDFSPNVEPVPAMRARLLVAQGRLAEAVSWASEQHLSAEDDLAYVREYEHLTLARILLARRTAERSREVAGTAYRLLERLRGAAEEGGRIGTLIEVLTLEAVAHRAAGPLEQALRLAEPEGYARIFLDEGAAITSLLEAVGREHPTWAYPRLLLEGGGRTVTAAGQPLVDPLSTRELDVLRLLASDLDGPGIARELVVSLNTVRTHTKAIYAKLGVNSRRAAVTRARELDLLSRTGHR